MRGVRQRRRQNITLRAISIKRECLIVACLMVGVGSINILAQKLAALHTTWLTLNGVVVQGCQYLKKYRNSKTTVLLSTVHTRV